MKYRKRLTLYQKKMECSNDSLFQTLCAKCPSGTRQQFDKFIFNDHANPMNDLQNPFYPVAYEFLETLSSSDPGFRATKSHQNSVKRHVLERIFEVHQLVAQKKLTSAEADKKLRDGLFFF
eukprot:GHVR01161534.1.p1 GENE.GHVR01161534.1~~GHVR01161534.1.p1  ORF type:complete len:121 (+),score=4.55 GHVR01161534.1:247-609(+)